MLHCVGMTIELVTDGRSDEVGAVRVETVLHHQIDMAEINVAEIDRDLLAIRRLGAKLAHTVSHSAHPVAIYVDGICGPALRDVNHLGPSFAFRDFRFQPFRDSSGSETLNRDRWMGAQ